MKAGFPLFLFASFLPLSFAALPKNLKTAELEVWFRSFEQKHPTKFYYPHNKVEPEDERDVWKDLDPPAYFDNPDNMQAWKDEVARCADRSVRRDASGVAQHHIHNYDDWPIRVDDTNPTENLHGFLTYGPVQSVNAQYPPSEPQKRADGIRYLRHRFRADVNKKIRKNWDDHVKTYWVGKMQEEMEEFRTEHKTFSAEAVDLHKQQYLTAMAQRDPERGRKITVFGLHGENHDLGNYFGHFQRKFYDEFTKLLDDALAKEVKEREHNFSPPPAHSPFSMADSDASPLESPSPSPSPDEQNKRKHHSGSESGNSDSHESVDVKVEEQEHHQPSSSKHTTTGGNFSGSTSGSSAGPKKKLKTDPKVRRRTVGAKNGMRFARRGAAW